MSGAQAPSTGPRRRIRMRQRDRKHGTVTATDSGGLPQRALRRHDRVPWASL